MDQLLVFLGSFLGGGVASAIINWFFSSRAAKQERKYRLLEEQVRELYGPLFYLVMQSEKLLELNKKLLDAYDIEFIEKRYSENELTRERVETWAEDTIGLANNYVKQVEESSEKIASLLNSKFSFIDPDDVELFLLFFEHRARLVTERDSSGVLRTPMQIYRHVGNISYLRPEFIERVRSQFFSKRNELKR